MSSVETVLGRGRAHAERLMTDTCTVTRAGTTSTLDEGTGTLTNTPTTVYTGVCRLKPTQVQDRMVEVGADEVGIASHVVSLPITETDPRPGDIVTVTASTYDAASVGRTFTILGALHGSQITARRLSCQEVLA